METATHIPAWQRKQEILDAALTLFAEKGYEATSTRALAHHLKVSESLIFRYFESKRDILLDLVDTPALREFEAELTSTLAAPETDEEERWSRVFTGLLRYLRKNRSLIRVLYDEAQRDREVAGVFYDKVLSGLGEPIQRHFDARVASGEYREFDTLILRRAFFGAALNIVIAEDWLHLEDKLPSDERTGQELARALIRGVLKR